MSVDIVAWRNCPLQKELGNEEFLKKLKLSGVLEAIDRQVPPEKREGTEIKRIVNAPDGAHEKNLTYSELREQPGQLIETASSSTPIFPARCTT